MAPGFVDLHTHYDSQLFWDPWCTMSGWHGVTSVVIGNCGFGFAPCRPEDRDRAMLTVSRNEAVPLKTMRAGMPWDWVTFPEFLDSVERTPKGVNVMAFVPLAPLYAYVVGVDKAKAHRVSDEELEEMCRLLVEAMEAGGCGWSAQISGEVGNVQRDFDGTPMVTDWMTEREVSPSPGRCARSAAGMTQITGPLETAALMARESGRPDHLERARSPTARSTSTAEPQYSHRDALKRLATKRGGGPAGLRAGADVHFVSEITLEDYNLLDIFPSWREACLGTVEEKRAKFADPERRRRHEGDPRRARRRLRRRIRPRPRSR